MKKISQPAALLAVLASFGAPLFVAAAGLNLDAITPYSDSIKNLINNILVPVLIAIAFITFLWGVYRYFIKGAADEKSRIEGRQFVLWGIIGFVIILSLWGIINLFMNTLGLTAGNVPPFPTIGGSSAPTSNSGGTILPAGTTIISGSQSQALSALTSQYYAYTNACTGSNSTSQQCQSLYNAYTQAHTSYVQQYGSTVGMCNDPEASNYGSIATCTYAGPTNSPGSGATACSDPEASNYGSAGTCTYATPSYCTDPEASNYGSAGTCTYATPSYCTDSEASNYGSVGTCTYY